MADLSDYRKEIDEIDHQLVPLFEQRMEVVRKVAAYKKEHNLPVLHAGREEEVLRKAADSLKNPTYVPQIRQFMNQVMELSRASQHQQIADSQPPIQGEQPHLFEGRLGYFGVAGSFTEQALLDFFGEGRQAASYPEIEDVFAALHTGEIDFGVVPIENSSTGSITKVYDLLGSYRFYIVGEQSVRISQNLVSVAGATLDTIRAIYSHAQGIEQSGKFLAQHRSWQMLHFHNTAISAKMVADEGDPPKAAIASRRAAELYGLTVVAPDIQDNSQNTTRFIVVAREMCTADADKVSISFLLDHASGTLYNVLRHFSQQQVNMVKIESRPIPDVLWNYRFYLDFEGDPADARVKALLESISRESKGFQMLGAYRSSGSRRTN